MLLKLKNLMVRYGTAEAIKGVTLQVAEDSVTSIVGANGAGKSTILKAVSALVPLTSGEILFCDKRIDGMAVHNIVGLGIVHVPEGRRLFPHMSVLANLRIGAYLRRDKASIDGDLTDIFSRFPILWQRRNQQARTLSGGEQQMLAIGRALMAKPKLLLLDEPSLGLAPLVIEELATMVKDINKGGVSVLLVEQNAGLVASVSERSYVLEVGKVVLEGNINDLMASQHVHRAFLGG
ncbi:MAG: ABC transporter ATP-binding protein [Dehalococcoidia bacterium]